MKHHDPEFNRSQIIATAGLAAASQTEVCIVWGPRKGFRYRSFKGTIAAMNISVGTVPAEPENIEILLKGEDAWYGINPKIDQMIDLTSNEKIDLLEGLVTVVPPPAGGQYYQYDKTAGEWNKA